MLNHTFTFNGHTSDEFGIKIEQFRALNRSARKYDTASVPGMNGNIYNLPKAWEENLVSYQIFAKASIADTEADFSKIDGTYFAWTADGLTVNGIVPAPYEIEEAAELLAWKNRTIIVQGGEPGVWELDCRVVNNYGTTTRTATITNGSETFVLGRGNYLYIDLKLYSGTYTNEVIPLKIIDGEILDLPKKWTEIMEWLNSADGYAELSDTYDTKHYHEAVFVDATDIENSWNEHGRAIVTFRCRPERFLVGYDSITPSFVSAGTYKQAPLANPTNHRAKPIIKIGATTCSTSSPAWVGMSGCQIFVSQSFSDTLVIDSEKENTYFEETGISANNIISAVPSTGNASDFMFIEPDQTVITKSNNMGSITLDARFWEI